jgi:hypothetical protein
MTIEGLHDNMKRITAPKTYRGQYVLPGVQLRPWPSGGFRGVLRHADFPVDVVHEAVEAGIHLLVELRLGGVLIGLPHGGLEFVMRKPDGV